MVRKLKKKATNVDDEEEAEEVKNKNLYLPTIPSKGDSLVKIPIIKRLPGEESAQVVDLYLNCKSMSQVNY